MLRVTDWFQVDWEIDGCTNASIECTFECGPFIFMDTISFLKSFVPCILATLSVTSVPLARNFSLTLWSMNDTVDPLLRKAYVFNLLLSLWFETGTVWRKRVTSLLWLIVAALTLNGWLPSSVWFSELSNWLCFLVHPFIPQALTLQSLIAFPFPRHP